MVNFPFRNAEARAARRQRRALLREHREDRLPPIFDSTKNIFEHSVFIPPANVPEHLHFFWGPSPLTRFLWRLLVIRFTPAGRWFAIITFALFLFGAITLEIQTYIPFLYASTFWLLAMLSIFIFRPNVSLTTQHTDRVRAGETLYIEAEVTHRGGLPAMDLQVLPTRLPLSANAVPSDGIPLGTLKGGETRRGRLGVVFPRRGVYTLWGWRAETDFPFGLMTAYRSFKEETAIFVHPNFTTIRNMPLPTGQRHHPGGVALASKLGESLEYLGNREFREGDNLRDIDWRATARLGGMPIVREYREEYFQRVGVVLDTFIAPELRGEARALRRYCFERAVSLSAAVSDYMANQEYLVDIFAAGPNLYHLTAGRSLAYLPQILDILACVEESTTEPLSIVAPQIQANLEQLTTVICVFLSWDEIRQTFVEQLRQGGAGVKVLLVVADTTDTPVDRNITVIDALNNREPDTL